jgi:3-dehydroquinate dehydratase II
MNKIHLINGPNLSLLGLRNPSVYGHTTLEQITMQLEAMCAKHSIGLESFQSDIEGELIANLGTLFRSAKAGLTPSLGIVFNPGAYAHTSVALRDAAELMKEVNIPVIEVHLSNIYARENFRQHSYVSQVAKGSICGLGAEGYKLACQWILDLSAHKRH